MAGDLEIPFDQIQGFGSPDRIVADLLQFYESTPSFSVQVSKYINEWGQESDMVLLSGTFPIPIQSKMYHFPMKIWLPPTYPREPPLVYCQATGKIKIKYNHPQVDHTGKCTFECTTKWNDSFNLLLVLKEIQKDFSVSTPMYTENRSGGAAAAASPGSGRPQSHRSQQPQQQQPQHPRARARSFTQPQALPQPQQPQPQPQQPQLSPAEQVRASLLQQLNQKMRDKLTAFHIQKSEEISQNLNEQKELLSSQYGKESAQIEYQQTNQSLEHCLKIMKEKNATLGAILEERKQPELPKEGVCPPDNYLSGKLLEQISMVQALDDCLYQLSAAHEEQRITFDQYIKSVRKVSRDQFFCKATAKKILPAIHPPAYCPASSPSPSSSSSSSSCSSSSSSSCSSVASSSSLSSISPSSFSVPSSRSLYFSPSSSPSPSPAPAPAPSPSPSPSSFRG